MGATPKDLMNLSTLAGSNGSSVMSQPDFSMLIPAQA